MDSIQLYFLSIGISWFLSILINSFLSLIAPKLANNHNKCHYEKALKFLYSQLTTENRYEMAFSSSLSLSKAGKSFLELPMGK
jgi:hypothetical protein